MSPPNLSSVSPSRSPYREHLQRKQINRQIKFHGPMKAALCFSIALVLYADIYHISLINRLIPMPDFMEYFKIACSVCMLTLAIGHLAAFGYAHLAPDREIEDTQAKLLNISNDDLGFKVKSKPVEKNEITSPNSAIQTLLPGSFCLPSAQNSFNDSFNNSVASTSWQFQSNSGNVSYRTSPSYEKLMNANRYPNARALDWHIDDEKSAEAFLRERSREQSFLGSIHESLMEISMSPKKSSVIDSGVEAIQRLFATQPYKPACLSPVDENKNDSKSGSAVICRRWNIDEKELFAWNEKLRCWFVDRVFVPLKNEIDNLNKAITLLGYGKESLIGVSNIPRLHNLAAQRSEVLPGLNSILLYLDLTTNQDYIVGRIREFCQSAALSSMNWNRGGATWTEQLPTDAEILMHVFATYIDSSLDPDPEYAERRQFTRRHTRNCINEKQAEPRGSKEVLFLFTKRNPPHYLLQLHEDIVDVGSGFNNVLHSIILFLYFHRIKKDAIISGKSMGRQGLDLLKIIS